MRLPTRIRHYLSRRHERIAHYHLGRAAMNSLDDLHRTCHLIAAMDVLENKDCREDCRINSLPKRMADRVTNALVPDFPPEDPILD